VTALKVDIVGLRHDVNELKSTDILMLGGNVDILEGPSLEMPAISKIPPTTLIGDAVVADDGD